MLHHPGSHLADRSSSLVGLERDGQPYREVSAIRVCQPLSGRIELAVPQAVDTLPDATKESSSWSCLCFDPDSAVYPVGYRGGLDLVEYRSHPLLGGVLWWCEEGET